MTSVRRDGQRGRGWVIALALMVSNWGHDASGQATGGEGETVASGPVRPVRRRQGGSDRCIPSAPCGVVVAIFGAVGGRRYALDAASASERRSAAPGGRVLSSPAVADGLVYVGSA